MTRTQSSTPIRRIVVMLDASESGRPTLDIALRLAASLSAELEGVFVEDINLIRLSGLPFVREVRSCSLAEDLISAQSMQRDLRALARRTERMFEQAAREMGVQVTFRVWRGRVEAETLSTSFEADLLTLGNVRSQLSYRVQPVVGTRRQSAAPQASTIHVLFNASKQAETALTAACHLAKEPNANINVLLPVDAGENLGVMEQANAILHAHAQGANFVRLNNNPQALAQIIGRSANQVLIAGLDYPLFQQAGLDNCLERLNCPLLFVR